MMNIFTLYSQLRSNPMQILQQKYNLPQNINDPQAIIQHLLNTGQISQDQVNQAMSMKDSPMFKGLFK